MGEKEKHRIKIQARKSVLQYITGQTENIYTHTAHTTHTQDEINSSSMQFRYILHICHFAYCVNRTRFTLSLSLRMRVRCECIGNIFFIVCAQMEIVIQMKSKQQQQQKLYFLLPSWLLSSSLWHIVQSLTTFLCRLILFSSLLFFACVLL